MTVETDKANEVRQSQREEWTAAAPGWSQYQEELSSPTRSITERLIEMAAIRPGQKVLDLACGTGDPAFSIAKIVGENGSVLGLDITTSMLEAARTLTTKNGVKNVEFRLIQSELDLGIKDESFDAAICRHGLMYMPEPVTTLKVLYRTLKRGGRIAVSTWGSPERAAAFGVPLGTILRHVQLPHPDPTAPGPFAISNQEALADMLKGAGFSEVRSVAFETSVNEAQTAEAYWDLMSATAGPLVALLASLPTETYRAIREDFINTLGTMFPNGPVKLGGEMLVAAGIKA
jgi:ubiquinone/menaquinone biosynthesis C-methylase UbiE